MEEAFLTIQEAARLLRLGERTTYRLAREGELPGAVKLGNQWRVDREVLMGWVRGRSKRVRGDGGGTR